jgi:ribosomal protein S18 acetylase RimI-like enzyme
MLVSVVSPIRFEPAVLLELRGPSLFAADIPASLDPASRSPCGIISNGQEREIGAVCGSTRKVTEVVKVSPDSWRMWRELRLAALAEAPSAFGSTLAEWSRAGDTEQRWRARLEDVALNLVVMCDGEAAGMVSAAAPGDGRPAELMSLWVAPSSRGRGVGDEAIRQVLAWVRENFAATAVELSVKIDNNHAIRLYERHGFIDAGPSRYGPGERLMRL